MKNIIKTIAITTIMAITLTGCSTVNEMGGAYIDESLTSSIETTINSVEEPTSTPTEETSSIESTASSTNIAKPTESTTSSEVKENAASSTTTTESSSSTVIEKPAEKPIEKPVASTSSTTSKPVEKPVEKPVHTHDFTTATCTKPATCKSCGATTGTPTNHNFTEATCTKPATCKSCGATNGTTTSHNFTEATCTKPATCKTCGATNGTPTSHNFKNGNCTNCGKNDPDYVKPHNCGRDGHLWGETYTEVTEVPAEIIESHVVYNCGYDMDLAMEIFGKVVHPEESLGESYGSGSAKVKTTGIKKTTRYYHKCSACGFTNECQAPTTENIYAPDAVWTYANKPRSERYPVVWYDVNNIPDEVWEGIEKDREWAKEHGFA